MSKTPAFMMIAYLGKVNRPVENMALSISFPAGLH
jgi:hypothetical protein